VKKPDQKKADWAAAVIVLAVGVPILALGGMAFASGEQARREVPVRGLVGQQAYSQWQGWCEGDPRPEQHYVRPSVVPERRPGCEHPRYRAPDFTLPTRDGGQWTLSEHRGKVIVINFWTTTCAPCMEEMPSLLELARILEDRDDIELITISVDRDWETVNSAVSPDEPLTVLLDPEREVVNGSFGTRLFPETWVIDGEGVIRLRVDGQRSWSSALALDAFETYL